MPYPHAIRLRGPWEFEVLEIAGAVLSSLDEALPSGRATLPCDWSAALGARFRGKVRYRRRFNRPTGLDPHERVWLIVEGVDAFGAVALNGSELGRVRGYALQASFDVTELIAPNNELLLDVELPPEASGGTLSLRPGREALAGGPIGEVRLEIRAGAFVDRLAVWTTHEDAAIVLHVSGEIGGNAADPMAVVVNGAERELLYGEVEPGRSFHLSDPVEDFPSDDPLHLQIKLLSGAVALWQCERAIAALGNQPQTSVTLGQILPEAAYDELDRWGQFVVQAVPIDWADEVCPRLARHGCIVAWAASAAELADAGDERLKRLAFGRPWRVAKTDGRVESV
jgi:hypothetical protein